MGKRYLMQETMGQATKHFRIIESVGEGDFDKVTIAVSNCHQGSHAFKSIEELVSLANEQLSFRESMEEAAGSGLERIMMPPLLTMDNPLVLPEKIKAGVQLIIHEQQGSTAWNLAMEFLKSQLTVKETKV